MNTQERKLVELGFIKVDSDRYSKCDEDIVITIDIYKDSNIYFISRYNYFTEIETKKVYKTFASVLKFLQNDILNANND